jgi:MFS family permease
MTSSPEITAAPAASKAINWVIFSLVCASYVASTIGEQVLGPIFPESTAEFGLTEADGGIAFGVLAISIAIMTLGGGWLLRRFRAQRLIMIALVISATGAALMRSSGGELTEAFRAYVDCLETQGSAECRAALEATVERITR